MMKFVLMKSNVQRFDLKMQKIFRIAKKIGFASTKAAAADNKEWFDNLGTNLQKLEQTLLKIHLVFVAFYNIKLSKGMEGKCDLTKRRKRCTS